MKILITGGRGFIGSHLVKTYPAADVIDLKDGKDITKSLPKKPYTHVFHLAALKGVAAGEARPREYMHNNVYGTLCIARTYRNARVLYTSSSSANKIMSVYGMTKKAGEIAGELHPNWLSVRLYNVFGEGQPVSSGALVPVTIKRILDGYGPIIYGGSQERDFTYVGDVVTNLARLMFTKTVGVLDLGYSKPITVTDMVAEIRGMISNRTRIRPKEAIFMTPRSYDIRSSRAPTPMPMEFGIHTGLRKTIDWHLDGKSRARVRP